MDAILIVRFVMEGFFSGPLVLIEHKLATGDTREREFQSLVRGEAL